MISITKQNATKNYIIDINTQYYLYLKTCTTLQFLFTHSVVCVYGFSLSHDFGFNAISLFLPIVQRKSIVITLQFRQLVCIKILFILFCTHRNKKELVILISQITIFMNTSRIMYVCVLTLHLYIYFYSLVYSFI